MKKLLKGIIDFRHNSLKEYRHKFAKLATHQTPDALLLACCDSRVVPNIFASSDPGDLFVLRNVGNLVPPYDKHPSADTTVYAAIEFALVSLGVSDIIICGHSACGAMQALLQNRANLNAKLPSLTRWLEYATPSYQRFKSSPNNHWADLTPEDYLSRINVLQQLDNLKTYPLVAELLPSNKLRLHGWWFNLATADLYYYCPKRAKFIIIDAAEAETILSSLT